MSLVTNLKPSTSYSVHGDPSHLVTHITGHVDTQILPGHPSHVVTFLKLISISLGTHLTWSAISHDHPYYWLLILTGHPSHMVTYFTWSPISLSHPFSYGHPYHWFLISLGLLSHWSPFSHGHPSHMVTHLTDYLFFAFVYIMVTSIPPLPFPHPTITLCIF